MSEDVPNSVLLSPTPTRTSTTTTTSPPTYERNGFLSTGSSPPAPQALLSSAAALSPGLPPSTTPPIPLKLTSPYNTEDSSIHLQRTPRAREPSSSSTSHLIPPESSSRPTSQTSFISNASSSHISSLNSPLCTPKVRDFAYPRTHKYHAPSFNHRRNSISSRSSTSSDLDSFFPQRIGAGPLYTTDDDWKRGLEDEQHEGDEEEFIEVDGDEESVERRAVCVFDFTAECEGEINIEIGQVVWVEFRKGVSGWLVVKDEITESKGLVPEGYVRFLNEDEERQYLAQSPPSNTLLPRDQDTTILSSSGEETPRPPISHTKQQWIQSTEDTNNQDEGGGGGGGEEWVEEDDDAAREDRNVDGMVTKKVMQT